jgi:SAM-dependent methyltransferase
MVASDLSSLAHAPDSDARHLELRNYRERLGRLNRDMAAFEADVRVAAREYALKQRGRSVHHGKNLKLNLGSGFETIDGWVSLDAKFGGVTMNLLRRLPFEDQSVDFACMCHLLEHFYFPLEAWKVLMEVRRILKPGGVLRIVVPDIRQCLLAYASGNREFFIRRDKELFGEPRDRNLLEYFLNYAGAASGPDQFMFSHKYGYDIDTLTTLVRDAGFIAMPSEFMASTYPELRIDKFSRSARAEVAGRKLSLFMDAAVPAVAAGSSNQARSVEPGPL